MEGIGGPGVGKFLQTALIGEAGAQVWRVEEGEGEKTPERASGSRGEAWDVVDGSPQHDVSARVAWHLHLESLHIRVKRARTWVARGGVHHPCVLLSICMLRVLRGVLWRERGGEVGVAAPPFP